MILMNMCNSLWVRMSKYMYFMKIHTTCEYLIESGSVRTMPSIVCGNFYAFGIFQIVRLIFLDMIV